jgi:hypothetical protein
VREREKDGKVISSAVRCCFVVVAAATERRLHAAYLIVIKLWQSYEIICGFICLISCPVLRSTTIHTLCAAAVMMHTKDKPAHRSNHRAGALDDEIMQCKRYAKTTKIHPRCKEEEHTTSK